MDALAQANARRIMKAELKRELQSDPSVLVDAIVARAQFVENARLGELLCALPRFGPKRASYLAKSCGVTLEKRVGTLTDRQATVLAGALNQHFGLVAS
jgi:hypothetical protein